MTIISNPDRARGRASMPSSRRAQAMLFNQRGRPAGSTPFLPSSVAYTLIELLIVISIIAILAGLILTVTGAVNRSKIRAKARAEMAEVIMGIENYKTKLGHYPPDTPNPSGVGVRTDINSLYYELCGTTNELGVFKTLDGTAQIPQSQLSSVFGGGLNTFINCSGRTGGDEGSVARRFIGELKPGQVATLGSSVNVKFLTCSVPAPYQNAQLSPPTANTWHYVSSNPTNNPNSYDLWVDVVISGKTNRICNWSREPLIVSAP